MHIRQISLYTNTLKEQKQFYTQQLNCPLVEEKPNSFIVKVGDSLLQFLKSEQKYKYHYCFLIPSNKLEEAIIWLSQRTQVIKTENEQYIQHFDTWNADAIYFHDASGNLAEFIVRHDLDNESTMPFDENSILNFNEIGTPTTDIVQLNTQLEQQVRTFFWKGDTTRFGTNGSQHGLFVIPNYHVKNTWFPTNEPIEISPYEAIIENEEGEKFEVIFREEKLKVIKL